ncbi:hypothetical protein L6R50_15515 [Myxococcota bacterium]|nr:hypothetical protein [Myxococcota bacterium]
MKIKRLVAQSAVALSLLLASAPAWALSQDDVINMVKVGVPDSIIISTIQSSDAVFTLSAQDIINLRREGVSDDVLKAMQGSGGSTTPAEEQAPRGGGDTRDEVRSGSGGEEEPKDDGEEEIRVRRTAEDEAARQRNAAKIAGTPPKLKQFIGIYKSKKYLTASLGLYELLEKGEYPEQEVKINYYLADSLYKLGLYDSAQTYFVKVVQDGGGTTYYGYALAKLVYIAKETGDNSAIVRLINDVNPDDFPAKVQADLNYLLGVRMFEEQNFSKARKYFSKVPDNSDRYLQSLYFTGVIYNRQGKLKQAVNKFVQVIRENSPYSKPEETERLKTLSVMNLGRIYYGIEQFDRAAYYYDNVMPRYSPHWPEALFEASWAYFMAEGQENRALGHIMTVESPFFTNEFWIPEVTILKALVYYRICEYRDVTKTLDQFESYYKPLLDEIQRFVKTYEQRELPPQHAYKTLYSKDSTYAKLPKAVFARIEANQNFSGPHRHVLQIEKEIALVGSMKSQWRDSSVGKAVLDSLKRSRKRYMKLAGIVLVNEMNSVGQQLAELMGQASIIRFEVASGEYQKYKAAARDPDQINIAEGLEYEFATNPEYVYWPFNNEYWHDELGFYIFTEKGSCE